MYEFAIKSKPCLAFFWRALLKAHLCCPLYRTRNNDTEIPSGACVKAENPPLFPTRINAIKTDSEIDSSIVSLNTLNVNYLIIEETFFVLFYNIVII